MGKNDGVGLDVAVVGDLGEVADFGSLFDHSVPQAATVDACVGTDLHVVANGNAANVGPLLPLVSLGRLVAKAVHTDHRAGLDRDTGADPYAVADMVMPVKDRLGPHY